MKNNTKRFILEAGLGVGLLLSQQIVFATPEPFDNKLSAQWWQWVLSIPVDQNPMLESDETTEKCMAGQRGDVWFLAGVFGSGSVIRKCSVPEGAGLFFSIANAVYFDSPNVCGQGSERTPIREMRAAVAGFIDEVTSIAVEVDGKPISNIYRVGRSSVYPLALPEDNVFDESCIAAGLGDVPAGIYSPTVDDGLYVKLKPLKRGNHTLHFHTEGGDGFFQDITYNLTVVPVLLK
ncbi:MAG: hypothetical protein ACXW0T_11775 [Methylobacter sp.]